MKLSVIVVNRNTCALLKQAVNSLITACKGFDYELFMIDNGSTDKSMEMIARDFPGVQVIANQADAGVSKASNQALSIARGEYILLVSPDTICGTDTIEKATGFMDIHHEVSGLAVRMLTPQGRFLPESIRGLTLRWVTFFKLIGFSKYFSKSRLTNRTRKDWVAEFQISEIDILNSDCMLLRSSVLNEIGLFDERFVQYGHNIDLSYRMRLAGFKNFYYPKTYIINYDSKATAKFSWSYIKHFYGAMFIFASKYLFKLPEIKLAGVPQLVPSSYEVK
ncbi:glycosyltransferase [soil metagenome]|jgi:GT2 family glycosyltransferase